jgi:hypothetical protein
LRVLHPTGRGALVGQVSPFPSGFKSCQPIGLKVFEDIYRTSSCVRNFACIIGSFGGVNDLSKIEDSPENSSESKGASADFDERVWSPVLAPVSAQLAVALTDDDALFARIVDEDAT